MMNSVMIEDGDILFANMPMPIIRRGDAYYDADIQYYRGALTVRESETNVWIVSNNCQAVSHVMRAMLDLSYAGKVGV